MARGILEMRHVPQDLREWNQFLKEINALITVENAPPGVAVDIAAGSVPITALENVPTAVLLGRPAIGAGAVQTLSTAAAAALVQGSIDHGSITGLTDDDHPQYALDADLTAAIATINAGLASGTYTPTLTNVTNVAASTAFECQYLRVGSTVHVTGRLDIDPTAAAATELGISLPIATNASSSSDIAGCAFCTAVQQGAGIMADTTNDRASMQFLANDTANRAFFFSFSYQVI